MVSVTAWNTQLKHYMESILFKKIIMTQELSVRNITLRWKEAKVIILSVGKCYCLCPNSTECVSLFRSLVGHCKRGISIAGVLTNTYSPACSIIDKGRSAMEEVRYECEKSNHWNPHVSNNKIFHSLSLEHSRVCLMLENVSWQSSLPLLWGGDLMTAEL